MEVAHSITARRMHPYQQSIEELIRMRTSWRTYSPRVLTPEIRQKLLEFQAQVFPAPFDGAFRVEFLHFPEIDPAEQQHLGTYGMIKGAQAFLMGIIGDIPHKYEIMGFVLEQYILYATDQGLGTCWLAGTFDRAGFAQKAHLTSDERIPAITPIGYPADSRRFKERLVRTIIHATNRKPWSALFWLSDFTHPLPPPQANGYEKPLEMVRLGPSASNGQPWRVVKDAHHPIFHFFVQANGPAASDKYFRFKCLDIGIALCHFELTCRELELGGQWVYSPPDALHIPLDLVYILSWVGQ